MAGTIIADKWQNGDGTENYKCRAWVNFNGTGTVAIRNSGNISSITDNGVGMYTMNFVTAMPDANYSIGGTVRQDVNSASLGGIGIRYGTTLLATSFNFDTRLDSGALYDMTYVTLQVFR